MFKQLIGFLYPFSILSIPVNKVCELGYYFSEVSKSCIMDGHEDNILDDIVKTHDNVFIKNSFD